MLNYEHPARMDGVFCIYGYIGASYCEWKER